MPTVFVMLEDGIKRKQIDVTLIFIALDVIILACSYRLYISDYPQLKSFVNYRNFDKL